ncbi:LLM class flavin-dependent oxidoreductase [Deinococcus sp. UYEF24]
MVRIFSADNPFDGMKADLEGLKKKAKLWEASETVERFLIGYSSTWPHNFVTAPYLLALTERLGLIVAHRPGVMHPAAAARVFGSMDVLSGGRITLNIVSGSSDKDLLREGDTLDKPSRYARATDYVEMMKRAWSEEGAFDYEGPFYQAKGVRQMLRPAKRHIPIYMGGDSDEAVDFGAKHADVYMLWGEPLAGTKERIARVRDLANNKYDREIEFSVSLRLIVGQTPEEAWEKAYAIRDAVEQALGRGSVLRSSSKDQSVGRARQLESAKTEVHDGIFWTALVALLGGFANSAALVGTEDQIIEALGKYRDLGADAFLLTTGVDGLYDPALEPLFARIKAEL